MSSAMNTSLKKLFIALVAVASLLSITAALAIDESGAAAQIAVTGADSEPVTIYLVRHAEKAKNHPKDPDLSGEGQSRAERLAFVLVNEPITHLFSTPLKRTRDTLAPLAAVRGLAVTTIRDVQEQAEALRVLPAGSVAVVAGHSNTVPALVAALGGQVDDTIEGRGGPQLRNDSYDRLFVVMLTPAIEDQPARLLRLLQLRYGAP
jgi:phosphohistidine phosphatase SixA